VDSLWGFVALTVLLSLTPGPDDVLVVSSSLRGGPRLGAAAALGAATGSLLWGAAAAVGLAAVVSRSTTAYDVVRLAGAGYLVVLGSVPVLMQLLRRAPRVAVSPVGDAPGQRRPGGGWSPAFAAGFLSDLLNPKIGMFYVAVVPQFVPAGRRTFEYSLLLCGIDVAIALSWLLALTWLASLAVTWLRRPIAARWVPRLCSVAFIGLGASVALGV
jgi:threonine/homoserine/homoserine lactone efflux protein